MRQVPSYTIIGDGKVASHICHYFNLLNIQHTQWSRRMGEPLAGKVHESSHILLLISDDSIAHFIEEHPELSNKVLIHFSGCLSLPQAIGAHPLMSFSAEAMPLADYQSIPFILEEGDYDFEDLFPQLNNPNWSIPTADKSYYHALCVMANNCTTLLWQKFFGEMQQRFQIPAEAGHELLKKTLSNLLDSPENALTGPLARGDNNTIEKNLSALTDDPYQSVYAAFKNSFSHKQ